MIPKEAIILAGGLGTRLKDVVNDLPKVMAPINGKPFLHYIITHLQQQKINRLILAVGYLRDSIIEWCNTHYPDIDFVFSVEEEPLGTGGGIAQALQHCNTEHVLILNGDTYFAVDTKKIYTQFLSSSAECTLTLKLMHNFDRYGTVDIDHNNCITGFNEKIYKEEGLINGGVYIILRDQFLRREWPRKFSFEKDYLEIAVSDRVLYGSIADNYFIDIGIPEDYYKCMDDFKTIFPDA